MAVGLRGTLNSDRRSGEDELSKWPSRMWLALQEKFGVHARQLAANADGRNQSCIVGGVFGYFLARPVGLAIGW